MHHLFAIFFNRTDYFATAKLAFNKIDTQKLSFAGRNNIPSPLAGEGQGEGGIIATSRKIRVDNFRNVWHIRI